jgi:FtsH-binding integral membrane protein
MSALPPESDLFDVLRTNWQQNNPAPAADLSLLREKAQTDLQKQHRWHRLTTLWMTVSFVFTIGVTTWVLFTYSDHGPLFYLGILSADLLMVSVAVLSWMGVQHERSTSALNSREHISKTIVKLRFRRFTIVYAFPVYMLLLLAALFCYYTDILAPASLNWKLTAYLATAVYMGLAYGYGHRKNRKRLSSINQLISELEQLKAGLEQPE